MANDIYSEHAARFTFDIVHEPGLVLGNFAETAPHAFTDYATARHSNNYAPSKLQRDRRRNTQSLPAEPAKGGLAGWQVRRVVEHIEAQLAAQIPVRALSEIARLSVAHFARAFRASFGMAPHRYIVDRRLRKASLLMVDTALPLCEIALMCGFADQPHFCRTFRKYFAQTPQSWRHVWRA